MTPPTSAFTCPAGRLHVIFGAGPLGTAVARAAIAQGGRVRLVTRSGQAPGAPGAEAVAADAADPASARAACEGADVVYQCAAPAYHRWTEAFPQLQQSILQAAGAAGSVLVAAENLYGYGVAGDLTEDLPMRATTRKGRVRAAMSARLIDAHRRGEVRAVAARASDFFGPGVRVSALGERLWPALLGGNAVAWFGDPDVAHSFTYVPDFAETMVRLGGEHAAWGRAWHVPSPPALSLRALLERAAGRAGASPPTIRRTPRLVLRAAGLFVPAAGEMVEMAYCYDQRFVMIDSACREAFDMTATSWDAALDATLAWWETGATTATLAVV